MVKMSALSKWREMVSKDSCPKPSNSTEQDQKVFELVAYIRQEAGDSTDLKGRALRGLARQMEEAQTQGFFADWMEQNRAQALDTLARFRVILLGNGSEEMTGHRLEWMARVVFMAETSSELAFGELRHLASGDDGGAPRHVP